MGDIWGHTGFDVRKRYTSKCDGKVTSCRYVCANEDHRRKGETDHVPKCFRAETRTVDYLKSAMTCGRCRMSKIFSMFSAYGLCEWSSDR